MGIEKSPFFFEKNYLSLSFGDQNAFLSSTKYLALGYSLQF